MTKKIILFISILIYGCQSVDINDVDKRNENWIYWVDSLTGEESWVPISDQTTIKDGRYTSFYKNGKLYEKGKLKNGENVDTTYCFDISENLIKYRLIMSDTILHHYIKEGAYNAYYDNLKIWETGIVTNHKRGDKWTRYYNNGNVEFIQDFKKGDGLMMRYYENGQIKDSSYTIKGENQGQIKLWFENGNVREVSNWNNGLQNGLYELYYENGKAKERTNWVNGKPESCESWYDNGQKKVVKYYRDGLIDAEAKQWYKNGNLEKKLTFSLGKINGKSIKYYKNGNIEYEGFYKEGKQDGLFIFYDEKGKQTGKRTYAEGKVISVKKL